MFLFALALLFAGCKANFPVAQQSGKDDVAYLLFVGQNVYGGKDVQVTIDNGQPFTEIEESKQTWYSICYWYRQQKARCKE